MDKIVCEFSENVFGKERNLHVIPNFDNQSPAAGQVGGRKMWADVQTQFFFLKSSVKSSLTPLLTFPPSIYSSKHFFRLSRNRAIDSRITSPSS